MVMAFSLIHSGATPTAGSLLKSCLIASARTSVNSPRRARGLSLSNGSRVETDLRNFFYAMRSALCPMLLLAVSDQKNAVGGAQIRKNLNRFAVSVLGLRLYRNFF